MDNTVMAQLKFTMNDRSQDVRQTFYDVLFHWMQNMDIHYLRQYESDFVQFLLNGIADDKLDIGPTCIKFLEEHGCRMKEAMQAIGEDEDIKGILEQVDAEKPSNAKPREEFKADTDMRDDK